MDFGGLILLALLWFFFKMVGKSREESAKAPRPPAPRAPGSPASGPDATQREGSRLEQLLRQLERAVEQGRSVPEVEGRAERAVVDQDEEAERVIARRAAAAAARSGPITSADHAEFERRIRQEAADHTAVRALTPQQLRDAVVWREILGPPVSERER